MSGKASPFRGRFEIIQEAFHPLLWRRSLKKFLMLSEWPSISGHRAA
jgi:hypothetical protein